MGDFRLRLGDRGRLVLPAEIRKRLDFRQGDQLVLTVQSDGRLRLANGSQAVRQTRGLYRAPERRRSLVDELIGERRTEARRNSSSVKRPR